MEMTKADYARHANLTKGRITQLTKSGQLLHRALMPNGKINRDLADQLRGKSFDPSNNMAKSLPQNSGGDDTPEKLNAEEEILEFRRRSAAVKAQNDELSLAERKGTLVNRDRLKTRLDDRLKVLFVNLRSSKLAIADRLIAEGLASGENRAAVLVTLQEETEKVIEDFRRSLTAGAADA